MKSTVYKLIIIGIVFFIPLATVFAQNQKNNYTIFWPSDSVLSNKLKLNATNNYFPRYQPDNFAEFPIVYLKIPVNNRNNSVSIVLNETSVAYIDKNYPKLSILKSDVQLNYHTVIEKNKLIY